MISKKMILGVYIGNFETYTRYSEVANKKKGFIVFLNSLKGAILKKSLQNSGLDSR